MVIGFNRCGGLGDGLVATAAVAGIREKYSDARIVGYLIGSPYEVFRENKDIDRLEKAFYIETPHILKEDQITKNGPWDIWFDLKPVPRAFFSDDYKHLETDTIVAWRDVLQEYHNGYIESCRRLPELGMSQVELISTALDLPIKNVKWKYNRGCSDYVTLCNEAWGEAPIKTYPFWNDIVSNIPYHVIQIGEFKADTLEGCENLAGKLSLKEACEKVASAKFHLGIEGFWNHFCETLNIPRVIVFGPTPHKFFGYSSPLTINIFNNECEDCWWKTSNWMLKCVNGYSYSERPCMQGLQGNIIAGIRRIESGQ